MKTNIERILIVDDEETACFIIEDTVKSLGDIRTAQTKDEAINIAKEFKPDIILLDIYVGVESGFDIRKEIISFLPNVSVIYITTTKKRPQ